MYAFILNILLSEQGPGVLNFFTFLFSTNNLEHARTGLTYLFIVQLCDKKTNNKGIVRNRIESKTHCFYDFKTLQSALCWEELLFRHSTSPHCKDRKWNKVKTDEEKGKNCFLNKESEIGLYNMKKNDWREI